MRSIKRVEKYIHAIYYTHIKLEHIWIMFSSLLNIGQSAYLPVAFTVGGILSALQG